jgi:SAM-dependent methyltransferase
MARWTRALAALPFHSGAVVDIGCAFGHATRLLRRHGYTAVGVDASAEYIARARRADPQGCYLCCDATAVPLPAATFDGALLLDVLEHLPDARAALAETARLLRPGGTLVLSVPQRGLLWWLDSLNLTGALVRRSGRGRIPPEIAATGRHRHYTLDELRGLLAPAFEVRRVQRTGLGLAETINLAWLVLFRWLFPVERLYQLLAYVYYTAYLVEDLVPLGPFAYHLLVVATRRTGESSDSS